MKKIAVVTGGASGIGLACAERFARDGCSVVIADVNEDAGSTHAKRLNGSFIKADLSKDIKATLPNAFARRAVVSTSSNSMFSARAPASITRLRSAPDHSR